MSSKNLFGAVRTRLLLDQPFFGSLAMYLQPVEDESVPTACVDGKEIRYNPEFLASLPAAQQTTLLAHETMHCALGHIFRRGNRDMMKWNIACDLALNPILVDSGFQAIPGWLLDPQYKGMSAEAIYAKLKVVEIKIAGGNGSGNGQGQSTPGKGQSSGSGGGKGAANGKDKGCPTGEFTDGPGSGNNNPETGTGEGSETEWKIATEQAASVAQAAGTLPGNLKQLIKQTHAPKVNWKMELRDFIEHTQPSDYSWTSPNRRFVSQGVYLPGVVKENTGTLIVAIDMSGSTWAIQHIFASELKGLIKEARPEKVVVIYWDTRVVDLKEYGPDDEIALEAKGGGGTIFQPVLDYVEREQIEAKAMICLTDLEIAGKMTEPNYPVLFAVPEFCNQQAPFGRVITVAVDK